MKIYFNHSLEKKQLKTLLYWFHQRYGYCKTQDLVDTLKTMGFHYATYAGISLGVDDLEIPPLKTQLVKNAERQVLKSDFFYQRGEITSIERFQKVIEAWSWTSEKVKEEVLHFFKHYQKLNPVYMMAFSGARGNISQVRQLVGMRGLMSDPNGHLIDVPIKNNFREGLTIIEYVISCYGARKGIVDTALKTANSGYLTRRLVEAAQAVTIHNTDCHTKQGIFLSDLYDEDKKPSSSLEQRLVGRVLMEHLYLNTKTQSKTQHKHTSPRESHSPKAALGHTQATTRRQTLQRRYKNVSNDAFHSHAMLLGGYNEDIKPFQAAKIANAYNTVRVRSPLTCATSHSKVCQLCYGWDLSQSRIVSLGEAVGMIAAQSIGEPGTQLTMRTFHTGGVFAGAVGQKVVAPSNGYVCLSDGGPKADSKSGVNRAEVWDQKVATHYDVFTTERDRLSGRKVRTQLGENALMTYKSFYLAFIAYETDAFESLPFGWSNGQNSGRYITIYQFPSQTLLFVTPGEWVEQKQVMAEIPEKAHLQRRTYHTSTAIAYSEDLKTKATSGETSAESNAHKNHRGVARGSFSPTVITNETEEDSVPTSVGVPAQMHEESALREETQAEDVSPSIIDESEEKVDVVSDFSGQVFVPKLHTLAQVDSGSSKRSPTSGTNKPSEECTPDYGPRDTGDKTWKATEPSELWVLSGTKFRTHLSFLRADKAFVADSAIGAWSRREVPDKEGVSNRENKNKSVEVRTSFVFFDKAHSTRNDFRNDIEDGFSGEGVRKAKSRAFRSVNAVAPEAVEKGTHFRESDDHRTGGGWFKGNAWSHTSGKAYQTALGVGKIVTQSNAGESRKKHRWGQGQVDFTYLILDESVQKRFCVPAISLLSQKSDSLAKDESESKDNIKSSALSNAYIPMTIGALVRKGGLIDGSESIHGSEHLSESMTNRARSSKVYKIGHTSLITEIQCKNFNLFEGKKEEHTPSLPEGHEAFPITQPLQSGSQNQQISVTVRKVKPYLLSTGALSQLKQWQMVDACSHLFQLPYNREKTGDIVQGLPKIDQCFEARKKGDNNPKTLSIKNFFFFRKRGLSAFLSSFLSFRNVQNICVHSVQRVYQSQGICLSDKHIEIIVRRMTSLVFILHPGKTSLLPGEVVEYQFLRSICHFDGHPKTPEVQQQYTPSKSGEKPVIFLPYVLGLTKVSLSNYRTAFLSAASFQETRRILMNSALEGCIDYLDELKQPVMLGETIPAGIAFFYEQQGTIVSKA